MTRAPKTWILIQKMEGLHSAGKVGEMEVAIDQTGDWAKAASSASAAGFLPLSARTRGWSEKSPWPLNFRRCTKLGVSKGTTLGGTAQRQFIGGGRNERSLIATDFCVNFRGCAIGRWKLPTGAGYPSPRVGLGAGCQAAHLFSRQFTVAARAERAGQLNQQQPLGPKFSQINPAPPTFRHALSLPTPFSFNTT